MNTYANVSVSDAHTAYVDGGMLSVCNGDNMAVTFEDEEEETECLD